MPDDGGFETNAGYVILRIGELPRTRQSITTGGKRSEIIDMDGLRIDKVLVGRLAEKD